MRYGRLASFLIFAKAYAALTPGFFIPTPGEYTDLNRNIVRRVIQGTVTISNNTVSLHIFPAQRPIQVQEQIDQEGLADLFVTDTTVTKTKAEINQSGSLNGSIEIIATANPNAPTGYAVQLFIYIIQLNLNTYSPDFFQFQANFISVNPALPATGSTPVYFTFPGTKLWLRLPEGGILSQSTTSDQIITSPAKSATIPIHIPGASFTSLPNGTYFFYSIAAMNPSAPPPNQNLQTITINNLIATINAELSNNNALIRLTPALTNQLLENRALLESLD